MRPFFQEEYPGSQEEGVCAESAACSTGAEVSGAGEDAGTPGVSVLGAGISSN